MVDDFFSCPHCGEDVRQGAPSCRHCGSSGADGWGDSYWTETDGYADDDFDYDEFVAREFGDTSPGRFNWRQRAAAIIILLVCLGLALAAVMRF